MSIIAVKFNQSTGDTTATVEHDVCQNPLDHGIVAQYVSPFNNPDAARHVAGCTCFWCRKERKA